ncbi:ferrochelatase [Bhargavaea cecembensis]|uniref:ferrochelatase n=1 Tax=Bhargavaea cecembensis TaxID=394098 RepID=UPI00058AF55C|nr:ferrochelatase [Bhargavaea cecembensis]
MAKKTMGLLVMAYGTPYKEEDIEPYYTHIRHGRKPAPEQLEDLKNRYEAIGGISPLARTTDEQAEALGKRLNEIQDDIEFKVYVGLKHIRPFIEDTVEKMHEDGITEAVTIVLAPHYSTFSVKSYNTRAEEKAAELGNMTIQSVHDFYRQPKFIQYWADKIKEEYASMPEEQRSEACLVVSAHSLPEKIKELGDPYPDQLNETAKLVADAAGVETYAVGWQSEGNTPDPWLGPDVQDLTRDLYNEHGYKAFVYTPLGFVAEHLEVLYDNDYECKVVCDEIGAAYYRPAMPNTDPLFIDAMADAVMDVVNQ